MVLDVLEKLSDVRMTLELLKVYSLILSVRPANVHVDHSLDAHAHIFEHGTAD